MPPTKTRVLQEDQNTTLKEKLNSLQVTTARARRNGAPPLTNGSSLKDVVSSTADTTSTNGGAQSNQNGGSGVSCQPKSQAF
jgi:histone deacetylase complex subunit SAP30